MKTVLYIILSLCFTLFCSCQSEPDDSVLLHGHEYKLWYIDSDDKYFPEFLYVDRDGCAYVLALDRKEGDFFEKQDSELTGCWKLKNDTVLILNNNCYMLKRTGTNPDTIVINSLQTENSMKLIDANFPPDLYEHNKNRTDENDSDYRKKHGYGIKQNPLLQGNNCMLWKSKERPPGVYCPDGHFVVYEGAHPSPSFFKRYNATVYPGSDTIYGAYPLYYYCPFVYFDSEGKMDFVFLTGKEWRFLPSYENELYSFDMIYTHIWFPVNSSDHNKPDGLAVTYGYENSLYIDDERYIDGERFDWKVCYTIASLPPARKNRKSKNTSITKRFAVGDTVGIITVNQITDILIFPATRDSLGNIIP
jgi:hypothetical protein